MFCLKNHSVHARLSLKFSLIPTAHYRHQIPLYWPIQYKCCTFHFSNQIHFSTKWKYSSSYLHLLKRVSAKCWWKRFVHRQIATSAQNCYFTNQKFARQNSVGNWLTHEIAANNFQLDFKRRSLYFLNPNKKTKKKFKLS